MIDLGIVKPGSTIRIPFSTFDKDDGSSITMTNYAAADLLVYKDGSTTERASTAGFTATTDFDSKTGKHLAVIDLADNTTAGFWNAGSEYLVAVDAVTVDAVTTGGWIARFVIGYPDANLNTTIATLSTQTSFTLTAGPAEDDALNGCVVLIHDIASAVQLGYAVISDYTGSTKTVTLTAGVTFTAAAGDNISVFPPGNSRWFAALLGVALPLTPTTAGRTLDVSAGGEAGVDWANVGSPTTTLNLSGTTVKTATDVETDTADIQTRLPAALVSGRMDSSVGAMAANVMTAAAAAADLTTELQSGLATAAALATTDGKVDSILADTGELQTDWANGGRLDLILDARASQTSVDDLPTNAELATSQAAADDATLAAIAALNNISVANILAATVEGSTTLVQTLRLLNAALGGKASGLATTTAVYRDLGDSKDRITATVDADGNRSAVTLDLT